jgi:hypothetical protein
LDKRITFTERFSSSNIAPGPGKKKIKNKINKKNTNKKFKISQKKKKNTFTKFHKILIWNKNLKFIFFFFFFSK